MDDIISNVGPSLEKSIRYGMQKEKMLLALTTSGLTDENLNYFLDCVVDRQLGGLLVWNYHQLTTDHLKIITERLELI